MTAGRPGCARPDDHSSKAGPQRRLDFQDKIDADTGAEEHRQPQQAALVLGREPLGEPMQQAAAP